MERLQINEIDSFVKFLHYATENNVELEGVDHFDKFIDYFRQHPDVICKIIWKSENDISDDLEKHFDEVIECYRKQVILNRALGEDYKKLISIHNKTNFGSTTNPIENVSKTIRENLRMVFAENLETDTTNQNVDFNNRANQYNAAKSYILSLKS